MRRKRRHRHSGLLLDSVYALITRESLHVKQCVVAALAENVFRESVEFVFICIVQGGTARRILRVDICTAPEEHLEHLLVVLLSSEDDEAVAMCIPVLDGNLLIETFFDTIAVTKLTTHEAQVLKLGEDIGIGQSCFPRLGEKPVLGVHGCVCDHILLHLEGAHCCLKDLRDEDTVIAQGMKNHWLIVDTRRWVDHADDCRSRCRIDNRINSTLDPCFNKARAHRNLTRNAKVPTKGCMQMGHALQSSSRPEDRANADA